jgi:hypothetical protein
MLSHDRSDIPMKYGDPWALRASNSAVQVELYDLEGARGFNGSRHFRCHGDDDLLGISWTDWGLLSFHPGIGYE